MIQIKGHIYICPKLGINKPTFISTDMTPYGYTSLGEVDQYIEVDLIEQTELQKQISMVQSEISLITTNSIQQIEQLNKKIENLKGIKNVS